MMNSVQGQQPAAVSQAAAALRMVSCYPVLHWFDYC